MKGDNLSIQNEQLVTLQPNTFINADCMDYLTKCPTNYFQLAIVDPPYGIGAGSKKFINGTSKTEKPYYKTNDWDNKIPNSEYFAELKRVSENQIIWGGNYFTEYLEPFRCFIFWDKTIHGNSYADGELAWTSFDKTAKYYRKNIAQVNSEGRIHPTQKPITLYKWLLKSFAKKGDLILDTHVGSGSSLIACKELGFDYVGFEIDKEYYEQAVNRISRAFRSYEMEL